MKSHIYERIAEILTDINTKAGHLPQTVATTTGTMDFTEIIYLYEDHVFVYSGFYDPITRLSKYGIDFKQAVRETWEYLNPDEQVKLMAEVLGARD